MLTQVWRDYDAARTSSTPTGTDWQLANLNLRIPVITAKRHKPLVQNAKPLKKLEYIEKVRIKEGLL